MSFKKCEKIEPDESDITKKIYKYSTSIFRSGYLKLYVNNIIYSVPLNYQRFADSIENFQVRDDDVWLMSYPKSGTTWAQEMIWMIANNLDFEGAKESLEDRFPFLEFSVQFEINKTKEDDFVEKDYLHLENSVGFVANLPSPRFIKTHLPWELLPKEIRNGQTNAKIIYVARNPKDVCISYYYHSKFLKLFTGNLEDFCDIFLSDLCCYTPFWCHVAGYWNRKDQPNILYLTYEQMKNDLSTVIRKSANFFNKEFTDENIEKLTKHLSFESMKENASVTNLDKITELFEYVGCSLNEGSMMRKGVVGSHKREISSEYEEKFNAWIKLNLNKYNLPLSSV